MFEINHFALITDNPEELADFYMDTLGLKLKAIKAYRSGNGEMQDRYESLAKKIRSVWLEINEKTILMLERSNDSSDASAVKPSRMFQSQKSFSEKSPGIHLIALSIDAEDRPAWIRKLKNKKIKIENQTEYTLYIRDPEGNRIGLSHYPEKVENI